MKKQLTAFAIAALCTLGAAAQSVASYPGGEEALNEYMATELKYPEAAKANGIEGIVEVSFTVKADGTVGAIKIKRMIDPDLEQEAIRLIKSMPTWTPATDASGRAIDSTVTLPVTFSLGD